MRLFVVSAAFASVLLVGALARADADTDAERRVGSMGRSAEQPMSLAFAIAEYEAGRVVATHVPVSPDDSTSQRPAPTADLAPKRSDAPPRACLSPDEPGCRLSSPLTPPTHF